MKEKEKNEPVKGIEIPIHFHNYKLLKDKEFILKGSYIYFVQGPNKVGKTSFLKALVSLHTANDDTPRKVTEGQSEGFYEATVPASDGTMVTIRHEFTEDKAKFIAIKENGEKISKVTEIRNLFNYTPINISEFFAMSNSAEGRRKQKEIILKLLPEKSRKEFEELDLEEEHEYDKRTDINRSINALTANIEQIKIDKEDLELIKRKKEAEDLLEKYKSAESAFDKIKILEENIKTTKEAIDEFEDKLVFMRAKLEALNFEFDEEKAKYKDILDIPKDELNAKIDRGNDLMSKINVIQNKQQMLDEFTEDKQNAEKELKRLTNKINSCRLAKDNIITKSDLPVKNISFEDGFLTIDGFQFKENQVCESDAVILLANILAKINPGPIQIIGDASILDEEKLKILNSIAEKHGKVMFVDEVVRTADDLTVVGYESIFSKDLNEKIEKISKEATKKYDKTMKKLAEPDSEANVAHDPTGDDLKDDDRKDAEASQDDNKDLLF